MSSPDTFLARRICQGAESRMSLPTNLLQALKLDREEGTKQIFEVLRNLSFDGVGVSRETYGHSETKAIDFIASLAVASGLSCFADPAGNMIVECPGLDTSLPFVATGSHLDSVPQGGNYDGSAGVVAGLLTLLDAQQQNLSRTLRTYILRGEESAWFGGPCYFGSRAMFGQLTDHDLESMHRSQKRPLRAQMESCGIQVDAMMEQAPWAESHQFAAWVELHIEQGPVLVQKKKPIGIVTGIRGNVRHRKAVITGEAGHSGAVPRWLRHDAVLAMAELMHRMDGHWKTLLEQGEDLVLTFGIVETDAKEHAVSRIPGMVSFSIEYRSQDETTLKLFGNLLAEEAEDISQKRKLSIDLGNVSQTKAAIMDPKLVALAQQTASDQQVDFEIMASGAGHDTAVFANQNIPSTMLFVRNENGSHNPHEAMDIKDFLAASHILSKMLCQLAL